jgi:hypothetical protein
MKTGFITLTLFGVLLMTSSVSGPGCARALQEWNVIPEPAEAAFSGNAFKPGAGCTIVLGEGCGAEDLFAAGQLNQWLAELGFDTLAVKVLAAGEAAPGGSILVAGKSGAAANALAGLGVKNPAFPEGESYLLAAGSDGVVVASGDAAGRFYGMMTLAQLFRRGSSGEIGRAHV